MGNVLATVSDRKAGVDANGNGIVDATEAYNADVVSAQDYYPFGMLEPGRQYNAGSQYRYGFNGKEQDGDIDGTGVDYDYGMRVYDARIGKFLSVDPLENKYPQLTPYQFGSNNPICNIDIDGAEGRQAVIVQPNYNPQLSLANLNINENFKPVTLNLLRQYTRLNSGLKTDWMNNVIAGNALENAYSDWLGQPRNTTLYFTPDKAVRNSSTRPDFVAPSTDVYNGMETIFPNGTFFEVKASQNAIDLNTSNKQIHAQLNALSKELGIKGLLSLPVKGADINALNYVLVLPANGFVSSSVKKEATKLGIMLWVTYAYQNNKDNSFVFSNPELLNPEILKSVAEKDRYIVKPYSNGKNSTSGVYIDYTKAKKGYKDSNEVEENFNKE